MLRLASDADAAGAITRGLRRRMPELDLVRAQDALPDGTPDAVVLAWAAAENVLIATTLQQPIGAAIDDILIIAEYMPEEEVRDRVIIFLPFQG